jgi:hypothetical protein
LTVSGICRIFKTFVSELASLDDFDVAWGRFVGAVGRAAVDESVEVAKVRAHKTGGVGGGWRVAQASSHAFLDLLATIAGRAELTQQLWEPAFKEVRDIVAVASKAVSTPPLKLNEQEKQRLVHLQDVLLGLTELAKSRREFFSAADEAAFVAFGFAAVAAPAALAQPKFGAAHAAALALVEAAVGGGGEIIYSSIRSVLLWAYLTSN